MQLSRARRLVVPFTSYHGACLMSVWWNISSLALEYSTQLRRSFDVHAAEFPTAGGSAMPRPEPPSCSSSETENQYLTSVIPDRTSNLELRRGAQELPVLLLRAEAHTCSTPALLYQDAVEQHDFAGRGQVGDVALEVPLGPLRSDGVAQRGDLTDARVEWLGDALDSRTRSRTGRPAFLVEPQRSARLRRARERAAGRPARRRADRAGGPDARARTTSSARATSASTSSCSSERAAIRRARAAARRGCGQRPHRPEREHRSAEAQERIDHSHAGLHSD